MSQSLVLKPECQPRLTDTQCPEPHAGQAGREVESAVAVTEAAVDHAGISTDRFAGIIASLAPTTMSGIRAKARAAVLLWPDRDQISPRTTLPLSRAACLRTWPECRMMLPWCRFDPARRTANIHGRGGWR